MKFNFYYILSVETTCLTRVGIVLIPQWTADKSFTTFVSEHEKYHSNLPSGRSFDDAVVMTVQSMAS